EHAQLLERVDDPADAVVGMFEERRVQLHLTGQHRFEILGDLRPRRDPLGAGRQLTVAWHDAELLLTGEGLLPYDVPPLVELTPVTVTPPFGHVDRGVSGAWCEVEQERLVVCQ